MMELIKENQLDIMISLSSICGIIAFCVFITGLSNMKKKALFLLEGGAMLMLMSDRYAYVYDGDTSTAGFLMTRISNFTDYVMILVMMFSFTVYLKEIFAEAKRSPTGFKRFRIIDILIFSGVVLCIVSQFTGLYYSFDEKNVYHRSDHYLISYLIPLSVLFILQTLIVQYYRYLSKSMRSSLMIFTVGPLAAAIIQVFFYGTSILNITFVVMAVLFYVFDLMYVSKAAEESERAKAANAAKSAFLSSMSHEIRTPITAILGMNEMILRESTDADVLNYSENIKTAGNTLLGLVNDILDFSKIEAGKIEIIPVEYDLSVMLNDLVNMINVRAQDKGLELKLDFDQTIPRKLFGDEVRIKEVITNILTNAVKYTMKGSISFSLGYEPALDDTESLIMKVSVKDTGIGIKPEDLDRLFIEFERIEEKRNRHVEGTGLGMSITRRLLEMMGSDLEVESQYGKGSVFSFNLKQKIVSREELGDYEVAFRSLTEDRKKYHESFRAPEAEILVVDDTPMNIMVFTGLLKQTGICIDTAESGQEGLELAKKKCYDMIFLDHMMPGKDGLETLKDIRKRADSLNRKTPAVCLTANAVSGAREEYLEAGFNDYLLKPIDAAALEEMLKTYLPKEKIIAAGENGEAETDLEDINRIDFLMDQSVIDVMEGLKHSGSIGTYLKMLGFFHEFADERAEGLEQLFKKKDAKAYMIAVHSIKSSVRIIGAMRLGDMAQLLEDACNRGDMEYLDAHHGEFIEDYLEIKSLIAPVFDKEKEEDKRAEADEETLAQFYAGIADAAKEMDYDRLEEAFEFIGSYRIPEKTAQKFARLENAYRQFDYRGIVNIVNGVNGDGVNGDGSE